MLEAQHQQALDPNPPTFTSKFLSTPPKALSKSARPFAASTNSPPIPPASTDRDAALIRILEDRWTESMSRVAQQSD
jgi:hypothetical protein